jgi:hypothetical protein
VRTVGREYLGCTGNARVLSGVLWRMATNRELKTWLASIVFEGNEHETRLNAAIVLLTHIKAERLGLGQRGTCTEIDMIHDVLRAIALDEGCPIPLRLAAARAVLT